MQKVRRRTLPEGHSASTACKCTVSGSISQSSSDFFSPFPHGTSSLSVIDEYLGLDGGPPRFPQNFKCSVVLRNTLEPLPVSLTGVSPSLPELSNSVQLPTPVPYCGPTTPDEPKLIRFRHTPFSIALLGESLLISLPPGTKVFQFPGFASLRMTHKVSQVSLFGNPRIEI